MRRDTQESTAPESPHGMPATRLRRWLVVLGWICAVIVVASPLAWAAQRSLTGADRNLEPRYLGPRLVLERGSSPDVVSGGQADWNFYVVASDKGLCYGVEIQASKEDSNGESCGFDVPFTHQIGFGATGARVLDQVFVYGSVSANVDRVRVELTAANGQRTDDAVADLVPHAMPNVEGQHPEEAGLRYFFTLVPKATRIGAVTALDGGEQVESVGVPEDQPAQNIP